MAALAVTQDHRAFGKNTPDHDELALLSIGTGKSLVRIEGKNLDWGYAQWARPIIDMMLDGVMGVADYQCRQILGGNYFRLAPEFGAESVLALGAWPSRRKALRLRSGLAARHRSGVRGHAGTCRRRTAASA